MCINLFFQPPIAGQAFNAHFVIQYSVQIFLLVYFHILMENRKETDESSHNSDHAKP